MWGEVESVVWEAHLRVLYLTLEGVAAPYDCSSYVP